MLLLLLLPALTCGEPAALQPQDSCCCRCCRRCCCCYVVVTMLLLLWLPPLDTSSAIFMLLLMLLLLPALTFGDPAAFQPSMKTAADSGEVQATQSNAPACSSPGSWSLQQQQPLSICYCYFAR
jgi:hypothetical protein